MENNLLKNFVTIQEFRQERPRLSIMNDDQVQEAINIATDLLDGICNGLISMVVQYSLSKEAKDVTHPLFRTDFELLQIKKAIVFQTHYVLNLGNDYTIGSQSMSTGGINYAGQRPESRQEIAPAVKEFLARARVFEITNVGNVSSNNLTYKECNWLKTLLTQERGDDRYLQKFQPNVPVGSIASVGDGNTITFINPKNTQWNTVRAKQILDIDGEYRAIDKIIDLAFFGKGNDKAMTRQEIYNAIWNSLFWNEDVAYPNEAIVRVYDRKNNLVYTFKSNQDNNLGHNPLRDDNKDEFWWKKVNVPENVNYDDIASLVITSKEFLQAINRIKDEFDGTLNAFWEQIKDNEHLLKKFEELYDQSKTENDQLEQKLDTKIVANTNEINTLKTQYTNLNANEIAYKNTENTFNQIQKFKGDAPHLDFYNVSDTRIGYVGKGKKVSGDLYVTAETNSLLLQAKHNIDLTPGNGYGARYDKTPTMDVEIANKRYVDNAVANGGGNVDLSNVAKTNENNIFSGANNFTGETTLGGNVTILRKIEYGFDEPIEGDLQLASKKYVDSVAGGVQAFYQTNVSWTITKKDVVSGLYAYIVNNVRVQFPSSVVGWEANVFITIKHQNSPQSKTLFVPFTSFYRGSLQSDIVLGNITFVSGVDLNPGAAGNFNSNLTIEMTIIKVKRVY